MPRVTGLRLTLYRKFVLVMLPAFGLLAAGSLLVAERMDTRTLSESLALRVGSLASRVASALGRHDALGNRRLAEDFLGTFGTDPAVRCAELHSPDQPGLALAGFPPTVGCKAVQPTLVLNLPVGEYGALLTIRYDDDEIALVARKRALVLAGILVAGMATALAAASLGFSLIVGRRLGRLHHAMSARSEGQARQALVPGGRDELSDIIQSYNAMLEREQALESKLLGRNAELDEQSRRDQLTGLHNRHHFESWLADESVLEARRQAGVVALIDVDHFKRINDTYGHSVGDEVLITLARRFNRALRPQDMVVRWGGEEFLLYCHGTQDATGVAERLLTEVRAQPVRTSAGPLTLAVSIGLVRLPLSVGGHPLSIERAVVLADRALYAAKHAGRDRALSVEAVNVLQSSQLAILEDDLRTAAAQGLVVLSESRPLEHDLVPSSEPVPF